MVVQYDMSKEKVLSYPAFGEKLFSIVSASLPPGGAKDKRSVVAFFRDEENLGFDTSCTYAWLKGDVLGSKPLRVENFKRILIFYIGKSGLNTIDEITSWIASGPKRYEEVLVSEEIQNRMRAKKILSLAIDHNKDQAERQKTWARLKHLVLSSATFDVSLTSLESTASIKSNIVIIQGPPGYGKTMFLKRLWSDLEILSRFDDVFQICCDSKMPPEAFLDFCLRKLLPEGDWQPDCPMVLTANSKKAIQGRRIVLLADNVSSVEEISALKPLRDLGCLLVVATRSLEVARLANYSNVIELIAYSNHDVLEFYSKNYTKQSLLIPQEILFQLAEVVCYNPLGLRIALRRVAEEGWEAVMKKIFLAPSICKEDIFEDLHKPLWLAYSSLNEKDQKRFRSLGVLPNLACYDEERLSRFWGVSKKLVNEILVRLEKEAGLVRRSTTQNGQWHIHPQVLNYARFQLKASSYRDKSYFASTRRAWHFKKSARCSFTSCIKEG